MIGGQEAAEAMTWTWFVEAVSLCYQQPDDVVKRMRRYFRNRGQSAFLHKLASQPSFFGRWLPSARSGQLNWLACRKEAQQAAALLPLLAIDALRMDPRGDIGRRARKRSPRKPGRPARAPLHPEVTDKSSAELAY